MDTLCETNIYIAPENRPGPKRKLVFEPSIFRGELLVSGRVDPPKSMVSNRNFALCFGAMLVFWVGVNHYTLVI